MAMCCLRWFGLAAALLAVVNSASPPRVDKSTLRLVQFIHRHGNRAPIWSYPNDPYKLEEIFPDGLGQLTLVGKQRAYELGRYLRKEYGQFLGTEYSAKTVHVRSTDCDRVLMTAQCILAALFPPIEGEEFEKRLPWQPIPIHTNDVTTDWLSPESTCEIVNKQQMDVFSSPEGAALADNKKYAKAFELVQQNAGFDKKITIREMSVVYDVLNAQAEEGIKLPAWVTRGNIYPEPLQSLYGAVMSLWGKTPEENRLKGGVIIKDMIKNIDKELGDEPSGKRLQQYAAHDLTIASVQCSLGVFNGNQPPFASAFILELHVVNDTPWIKFLYRNDTSRPPYPLRIDGCDNEVCSYDQFLTATRHIIPVNWENECKLSHYETPPEPDLHVHEGIIRLAVKDEL